MVAINKQYNNHRTGATTPDGSITTYTWTDDDQLAAVTLPNGGGTITNTYNGDGMRFSRTDANGTSSFAWNGKALDAQLGAGNSVTIHKNLSRCAGAKLLHNIIPDPV